MNLISNYKLNEKSETSIFFISHASVVIRYDDYILVTDPYFISPAFTTWKTSPYATISPDVLITLSKGKKLGFIISHAHEDHFDHAFLNKCSKDAFIFICKFPQDAFKNILQNDLNFKNIIELESYNLTPIQWGPFEFNGWLEPKSDFDAVIAIASPDAFIFHGNDSYGIHDEKQGESINVVKNRHKNKKSLFMGQSGTASGWPLNYYCYDEDEKIQLLEQKVSNMVKSIANTCKNYNFDKSLAYAMLTRIDIPEKDYSFKTKTMSGNRANEITKTDYFIDMHPGDVYIPNELRVIKILGTLDYVKEFNNNMGPSYDFGPEISKIHWHKLGYHDKCENYVKNILPNYIKQELNKPKELLTQQQNTQQGKWVENDFDLTFKMIITDNYENNNTIDEIDVTIINGTREKTLRVPGNIMAKVCDGDIAFRDLYIGYLGEFSRKPLNIQNGHFLQAMHGCGVGYFKTKSYQIGFF